MKDNSMTTGISYWRHYFIATFADKHVFFFLHLYRGLWAGQSGFVPVEKYVGRRASPNWLIGNWNYKDSSTPFLSRMMTTNSGIIYIWDHLFSFQSKYPTWIYYRCRYLKCNHDVIMPFWKICGEKIIINIYWVAASNATYRHRKFEM